jgi:sec-independent protein translocase protein TatC
VTRDEPQPTTEELETHDEASMSVVEHLDELRSRIIVVAVAIALAAVVGFFVSEPIIGILQAALPPDTVLIQLTVGEALGVRLHLALVTGIALAMPIILYEVWAFVTPGLTRGERRLVWPLLGAAIVLFVSGVVVGYLVLPIALTFLIGLSLPDVPPTLHLSEYISFATTLMIAFGLALQFPVVLVLLARVGILSYRFLAARRRYIIVIIVMAAILLTPQDPISTLALSTIMYGLFEATLQVIRFLAR